MEFDAGRTQPRCKLLESSIDNVCILTESVENQDIQRSRGDDRSGCGSNGANPIRVYFLQIEDFRGGAGSLQDIISMAVSAKP